jgi:hypothetical protein
MNLNAVGLACWSAVGGAAAPPCHPLGNAFENFGKAKNILSLRRK